VGRVVLVDTNVLYAVGDRGDRHHQAARDLLEGLDAVLLVAPTVVAEVCYLLSENIGTAAEVAFLRDFATGALHLAELTGGDLVRMGDLAERCANLGMGGTDASVIAIAERLGVTEIATFDRRHFTVVRPAHAQAFTLLPQ
jgi:predicted nucleic acid-binding protein